MRNVSKSTKALILAGLSVIVIVTAAWQTDNKTKRDSTNRQQPTGDTTVPKQHDNDQDEYRVGDIDKAMKELDNAMQHLNIQMKDLNINISKEINDAISRIDAEKLNKEIQDAMKNIDFEKIKLETDKSLKEAQEQIAKIDTEKMKEEIEKAKEQMKNIDLDNIKVQIDRSMKEAQDQLKNIDMQKIKTEMQDLQLKLNNQDFKKQIDSAMKNANLEIEKAKKELQDLKNFTEALAKDGLIDKKKGYTIEWTKDGDLIINGTKQPKSVSDKYSQYYKKDGYKIKSNGGDNDLNIESL